MHLEWRRISKLDRGADQRHAAASYAHLELLAYLLSVGGDINLTDDEGETPLFTVETMEAAQYLVANGANVAQENEEGVNVSWRSSRLSLPPLWSLGIPTLSFSPEALWTSIQRASSMRINGVAPRDTVHELHARCLL